MGEEDELDGVLPEIRKEDLEFGDRLGAGTYGAVWQANWRSRGNKPVAVKRVLVLQKEASILNHIRHKNIVEFYGICYDTTYHRDFYIVTELAEKGSLKSYLDSDDNPDLDFPEMLSWAIDIARGVYYLHFEAPIQLLHRDLKSANVVISAANVCKICDFGTARTKTSGTASNVVGTTAWMSPEMINMGQIGMGTDVWSYAVVLWELITRDTPFKGHNGILINDFKISVMVVDQGVRLTIPSTCPEPLAKLMKDCWETDQNLRPGMNDVLSRLQDMKGDRRLSKDADDFLKKKEEWQEEIQNQIQTLMERESELDMKADRLRQEERRLRLRPVLRRVPSYDVQRWNEDDVCNWLLSKEIRLLSQPELGTLSGLFHEHHIDGARLLQLTEMDLERLGLDKIGPQKEILSLIKELRKENHRLLNFPPLNRFSQRPPPAPSPHTTTLTLTLLFGFYLRRLPCRRSTPLFRWKVFMDTDIDDLDHIELLGCTPSRLIKSVTFCLPQPYPEEPMNVAHSSVDPTTLFLLPEWMEGLSEEAVTVTCVVNYRDDLVKQPRNTRSTVTVHKKPHGLQILTEKQVDLVVRLPKQKNKLHPSASAPSLDRKHLQGAWKERMPMEWIPSDEYPSPTTPTPQPAIPVVPGESPNRNYGRATSEDTKAGESVVGQERSKRKRSLAARAQVQFQIGNSGFKNYSNAGDRKVSDTTKYFTPNNISPGNVPRENSTERPRSFSLTPDFRRKQSSGTSSGSNTPAGSQPQPTTAESNRSPQPTNNSTRHYYRRSRSDGKLNVPPKLSIFPADSNEIELPNNYDSVETVVQTNSFENDSERANLSPTRKTNLALAHQSAGRDVTKSGLSAMVHGGNPKWCWVGGVVEEEEEYE